MNNYYNKKALLYPTTALILIFNVCLPSIDVLAKEQSTKGNYKIQQNSHTIIKEGTITPNEFTLHQDKYLEGSYTGNTTKVQVRINGISYNGGNLINGAFSVYVYDKIKHANDVVTISALDKDGKILETRTVIVKAVSGTISPEDYMLGKDNYVNGHYTGSVAKVKIKVNGTEYNGGTVENGAFKFYAYDKIKKATDNAMIYAYDKQGRLLDEKKLRITEHIGIGTITLDPFVIGTSKYLTGVSSGDVTKIELHVDGTTYSGGTILDNRLNFYAYNKIVSHSKTATVIAYDKHHHILDTKTVPLTQSKKIKNLTEATWITKTGMSKGKNHDRQDLGTILQPNAQLKIRQTNPAFKDKLNLHLLTNDRNTEKAYTIGSEWTTITAETATTPFITTPLGDTPATIEYKIEGNQKPLPIYEYNNSEAAFFETWDKNDSQFALIKHKDFQLYAPKLDKEAIRNLDDFPSINDLIKYYEGIFKLYNTMIGLKAGASDTDKMTQNRYFLKADTHGPGGAYYSGDWTANSEPSVNIWLDKGRWSTLHEIGHGYQSGFDGKGMYTGEVSNNLFAVQYQYELFGKEQANKIGWLFNGSPETIDRQLYQKLITEGQSYATINDLRLQLVLLTMLKQKAGNEAFANMHQEYRKLASQPAFNTANYMLPDLMNKYYSTNSHYDFSAALQRLGLIVDTSIAETNRAKDYQAIAFLADVVPLQKLAAARKLIDDTLLVNSNFEMVDNRDIAPLGLTGDMHITLDIDDLNQLKGKKLKLKDGTEIVKEVTITSKDIVIPNIPNGIYTLDIPTGNTAKYTAKQHYIYVKEATNKITLTLEKMTVSSLANQSIQFLGLSDAQFATFDTNLNNAQATFDVTSSKPHSYFPNEKYIAIEVRNASNQLVYKKEVEGTNAVTGRNTFPLNEGDKITVFHAETNSRLKSKENIIDTTTKENHLIMTKWGLKNTKLQNNTETDLIKKIESSATIILNTPEILQQPNAEMKNQLWTAIMSLSGPNRTKYLQQYAVIFND